MLVNPVALHLHVVDVDLNRPSSTFGKRGNPNNNCALHPHAGNPAWNRAYKTSPHSFGILERKSYTWIGRKTCMIAKAKAAERRKTAETVVRGIVASVKWELPKHCKLRSSSRAYSASVGVAWVVQVQLIWCR